MTNTKELQQKYWTEFRSYLAKTNSFLEAMGNPLPLSWHAFKFVSGNEKLEAVITSRGYTRVELYLKGNDTQRIYAKLKDKYETDPPKVLGKLIWAAPKKSEQLLRTAYPQNEAILKDDTKWEQQFKWLKDSLESMYNYFEHELKTL